MLPEGIDVIELIFLSAIVPSVLCAIHLVNHRQSFYWLPVFLFMPWVGAICYFFGVYLTSSSIKNKAIRANGLNILWCLLAVASIAVLSLLIMKEYDFSLNAEPREGKITSYGVEKKVGYYSKSVSVSYVPWLVVERTGTVTSSREVCEISGSQHIFEEPESPDEKEVRERLENIVKSGNIHYYSLEKENGAWLECRMHTNLDNTMYWIFMSFAIVGLVWSIRKIWKDARAVNEEGNVRRS